MQAQKSHPHSSPGRPCETVGLRIISGGQTGADRAALDFAIDAGIDHGGYCPKGRFAEDGSIPLIYDLIETAMTLYQERAKLNVEQSDATLIVVAGDQLSPGSKLTAYHAARCGKPCRVIFALSQSEPTPSQIADVKQWLAAESPDILNVAGSRGSSSPHIYRFTRRLLEETLL